MPDVRLPADWRTRLVIGGLGGLTLVIVRATQLQFYTRMKVYVAGLGAPSLVIAFDAAAGRQWPPRGRA